MAKILSAKEAKLQKKLIPLNIFVFILSVVAVISLIFAPLFKVDVGKILREEKVIDYTEDTLGKLIDENLESSTEEGFTLNFTPVITAAISEVLGKADGTITFTTFEVCGYAADKREDKLEIILEGLFYGKNGVVTELVNSLVEGVTTAFTSESGKTAVEDAVVDSFISSMGDIVDSAAGEGSQFGDIINEKLTEEKAGELKDTFMEINNAKSEEDVVTVIDTFVDRLNEVLGDEYTITQENKEMVTDYVVDIYRETIDAIQNSGEENKEFSLEAMICVAVNSNVDLGGVDVNKLLQDYLDKMTGTETASIVLTEGEEAPSAKPPLSYSDLFAGVGLSSEKVDEISDTLNKIVRKYVADNLAGVNESLQQTGWVYQWIYFLVLAFIMVFVLPWFILALAALFRTFAKNKRYMTWYVKLFGFIPALVFVGLFVVKTWGPALIFKSMAEETLGLVMAAVSGVSSFTWVCGLCYILLWLVSIFWAFPIKHKIRKERKLCKQAKDKGAYDYSDFEEDYGYSVSKEETPAYAPADSYGEDYDYGYEGYDDDYDYGGYLEDYDEDDYGFDDDYDEYSDYDDEY